jgi:hypothetical protein
MNPALVTRFNRTLLSFGKRNYRPMPWRDTRDPYRILVSELMLQQTQVARVMEKYPAFMRKFPTVRSLARAPLGEVLVLWSGLGYNRRAKYLHLSGLAPERQNLASLICPHLGLERLHQIHGPGEPPLLLVTGRRGDAHQQRFEFAHVRVVDREVHAQ